MLQRHAWKTSPPGAIAVRDVLYVILTLAFFTVGIAYVYACDKLK